MLIIYCATFKICNHPIWLKFTTFSPSKIRAPSRITFTTCSLPFCQKLSFTISSYSSIKRQEIHKNRSKIFRLKNISKKKLKEHSKRLQGTIVKLEEKNYYLKREGRVLKRIIKVRLRF